MGLEQYDIQGKILFHYDRLEPWLKGEVIYPINVEVDPTNSCNEKCPGCCWEDHRKNRAIMPKELLEKILCNWWQTCIEVQH